MFKALLDWMFAREDELETPVLVHDFTVCKPGHDISLTYYPGSADGYGAAVITSLEKIQVGEFLDIGELDSLFVVNKVEEIAPMVFHADVSLVEGV